MNVVEGSCENVVYPDDAIVKNRSGVSHVRLRILADGTPELVEMTQSSGHTDLDDILAKALMACRSKPAMKDGQAVSAELRFDW
ncbi:TonB family protein [Oxalobacteraceae bacterium OM1]|nr:TonB family protein [Oxalobacteraceae bacterium OM1]